MASMRRRGKVWYFTTTDADGIRRERKGCPDRRATEEMARDAESLATRRRAGLIDPKAESYRDHGARPLSGHLDDFEAALLAKGSTPKHARHYGERARRVAALSRGARLSDIIAPARASSGRRQAAARAVADGPWTPRACPTLPLRRFNRLSRRSATPGGPYRPATTIGPRSGHSPDGRGPTGGCGTTRWPGLSATTPKRTDVTSGGRSRPTNWSGCSARPREGRSSRGWPVPTGPRSTGWRSAPVSGRRSWPASPPSRSTWTATRRRSPSGPATRSAAAWTYSRSAPTWRTPYARGCPPGPSGRPSSRSTPTTRPR